MHLPACFFLFFPFFFPFLSFEAPPGFDSPVDANVRSVGTRGGDLVIVATDGLFDNVEMDEVGNCTS